MSCDVMVSLVSVHCEFSKCTTYACDKVRTIFSLEPCMRCRDDAESDHRTRKTTSTCQRTRARQALGQIDHNACLKHSNSSTDQNSLTDQLLCSWNIMATAREQVLKQLASDSDTVRSPNVSDPKSLEFQLLCFQWLLENFCL